MFAMESANNEALYNIGKFRREEKGTRNGRVIEAIAPDANITANRRPLADLSDSLSTFSDKTIGLLAIAAKTGFPSLYTDDFVRV